MLFVVRRGIYFRKELDMDLTCHDCGFTAEHVEFKYLCKSG